MKKKNRKKKLIKNPNKASLIAALFIVVLFGLFFETVKTIPVGAFSENISKVPYKLPKLNSQIIEDRILKERNFKDFDEKLLFIENNIDKKMLFIENNIDKNLLFIEKTIDNIESNFSNKNETKKEELIVAKNPNEEIKIIENEIEKIQNQIENVQAEISEIETKVIDAETIVAKATEEAAIIVAKAKETQVEEIISKTLKEEKIDKAVLDIPKVEETIKMAADTSTNTIIVEGEEKIIAGSSEKNITYMQILQNPNDLDLNLKYARQQGKAGNFKQTISTLERLNMLYPDNVEIKLYLLSVLVQADSPNKALTVIEEIKNNEDLTQEDLTTVNEIEEEMKARGRPKLWNFYADIGLGGIQNNNVNSVSKTRTQSSSDSVIGFNSAKIDRTYSGSLGLTATRSLGEASSFMINVNSTDSDQEEERGDDFESYGLTLALDTSLGNQSLSPYFMLSKTDYQDDADSFSSMYGIGGYFPVGDRHSFSYGYSYSDSKGNQNSTDTTADATNAIGHGYSLGYDFAFNEIISTSTGLGYSDSDGKDDTNDYETYDFSLRMNFAYPWAYISVGDALSFNDYKKVDTSINSNRIRSDVTNTIDIMLTKSVGDFFPSIDPNRSLFINLSYEKLFSEANIINYDYISDSVSLSFSKSNHLNKWYKQN